jgi:sulfatase maturation enzyme AslB (radical SAM superfamily)
MSHEEISQQPEAFSELPFAEFVTKTANGCNMQPLHASERDPLVLVQPGCDHCYMYTHSNLWRSEPPFMELGTIEQTAVRIAEHADSHNLPHVRVIAHGGEPLLALTKDKDYYSKYADIMHQHIDRTPAQLHLYMQTNGLLLNERRGRAIIDQLSSAGFNIGLSIDGNQAANDLHRRDRGGRSTHSRAVTAARLLHEKGASWGVLGAIDPRTNPEETVEYLASLSPQTINLFPLHANNTDVAQKHPDALPLGEWQKRALNWYINWSERHPGEPEPPFQMPIYDNYLRMAFGAPSINDTAGARQTQELFITPSGMWERLDTLKSADDGAVYTGLNVFEHSLDDLRRDPGIIARRMGFSALSPICQGCDVLNLCFGNHYPNRYKQPEEPLTPESSVGAYVEAFRNPSGHCEDHRFFLGYVEDLVKRNTRPAPIPAIQKQSEPTDTEIFAQIVSSTVTVPKDARDLLETTSVPDSIQAFGTTLLYRQMEKSDHARTIAPYIKNSLYANFPLQQFNKTAPLIPREDILMLRTAVLKRELTGRIALEQLRLLSQQHEGGKIGFSGGIVDKISPHDVSAMLCEDLNDAIVHAILHPQQPYLHDIPSSKEKAGGYWFVGQDTAQRIMQVTDTAKGFVGTAWLPSDQPKNSWLNGAYGIDFAGDLSSPFIPRAIPVSVDDLPQDLLIVEGAAKDAEDMYQMVKHAAAQMHMHANPELLAQTLAKEGITITPLSGKWPSHYLRRTNWKNHSFGAQPSTAHINNAMVYSGIPFQEEYERVFMQYNQELMYA